MGYQVDISWKISMAMTLYFRLSVEVETQMTAVERVLDYCTIEVESLPPKSTKFQPTKSWPMHGKIVLNNVSVSYPTDLHSLTVLHRISATIEPGEKVAIVGRTGAGKTSLVQTLFRMSTLSEGYILIDDIDIDTIALNDLRHRISIIPQNPILFTGTIRSNLDQFRMCSDNEIWQALEQVTIY